MAAIRPPLILWNLISAPELVPKMGVSPEQFCEIISKCAIEIVSGTHRQDLLNDKSRNC